MAERDLAERLQPSLLDRLTDDAPEERGEPREARVIDMARLRDILRRDLAWLLNTNNLETAIDEERHPQAAASTVNYGVREVAGDFAGDERAERMRASIRLAIERFEPRIAPGTLEIVRHEVSTTSRAVIAFDISAEMWAQPMPLELYLRTEIDVTTGEVRVEGAG